MTVFNTAYDTTACNMFPMRGVVDAIQEAQLRDYLPTADSVLYVESSQGASGQVKAFKHALYINKHHAEEIKHSNEIRNEPLLAIDVRNSGRFDVKEGQFKITNSTLFKNIVCRAALTSLWLTNGAGAFRNVTPMAMAVFASWISETVAFRYSLDPKAKIDLMIVAALFYQSNQVDGTEFDKANEGRFLSGVAGAMKVNITEVNRIYEQTHCITSLEDFCTKAKTVLNNVRLENLNAGLMVALMGGTWGGDNAVELTAVSLEHPPTWLSLLFEAHTNQAMRKVGLSKIVERRQFQEQLDKLTMLIKVSAPDSAMLLKNQGIAF